MSEEVHDFEIEVSVRVVIDGRLASSGCQSRGWKDTEKYPPAGTFRQPFDALYADSLRKVLLEMQGKRQEALDGSR